jgi:hypothetical protein
MKRIIIILLLTAFIFQGFSQVISAENKKQVADTNETARLAIGKDFLLIEETPEATKLKIGERGVSILESLEGMGPKIVFENFRKDEVAFNEEEKKESPAKKRSHFKGHWAGLEAGFNNYTLDNQSLTLPDEINYMTLHSGKSRNINLNFGQLSIGLGRHVGFVTGLGIGWNNYRFDGNYNIQKIAGIIDSLVPVLGPGESLKKSKLSTLYLKIPFLLEFQIPTDHHRLNISAGPVGAIKLGSYSVMQFENDDKIRSDDDFNLNLLRYGATARIGYENFSIYGTYYFTPLFKTNMGPGGVDLFPFELGIAFNIDD